MTPEPLQVLLVEDDPKVSHTVASSLKEHGIEASRFGTGNEAISHFEREHVDLVVLDLGLPDVDGLDVLRTIREKNRSVPVLILTARDAVTDVVTGLDAGADDYLVKPFSLFELMARLRTLTRRVELGRQPRLAHADLEMDAATRVAVRAGQTLDLSPRETDLLYYLLEHQGQVVTRSMLARDVWNYRSRATPIDNIIDVQMSRLREKVDKPFASSLIRTVRGVGFVLAETE